MDAEEGLPQALGELKPEPGLKAERKVPPALFGDIEVPELLLGICGWLDSPRDLGRLACTSRAFVRRTAWEGSTAGSIEWRSVIDESARRWVLAWRVATGCDEDWSGSWLWRMHEVQASQLIEAAAEIALSEQNAVATVTDNKIAWFHNPAGVYSCCTHTAASGLLMSGTHYAVFALERVGAVINYTYVGLVAEGCDVRRTQQAPHTAGNCFIDVGSGQCMPVNTDWPGRVKMKRAKQGDRVGLLFDTAQGSLTVFLNDRLLGVAMSGLSGRYRWAISMVYKGNRVRISRSRCPP